MLERRKRKFLQFSVLMTCLLGVTLPGCRRNRGGTVHFATPTFKAEYLFVASTTTNLVSTFVINTDTGALTAGPGYGILTGRNTLPAAMVADPSGRFLYVADQYGCAPFPGGPNPGCVSVFAIDRASGALSAVPGSPFPVGSTATVEPEEPKAVAVDAAGKYLYVAGHRQQGNVSAFAINPTSGALTQIAGSPFQTGLYSGDVAVDPLGFLYVVNAYDSLAGTKGGTVAAFAIDPSTGALKAVAGSPFPTGLNSSELVKDPSGRFLYVANTGHGDISAFTVNSSSGTLTPVAGSPFPVDGQPAAMAVDRSGKFLYVTSSSGFTPVPLLAFSIDDSTGALKRISGSPYSVGFSPHASIVDPSGKFLYVGCSDGVSSFIIDAYSGALAVGSGFRPPGDATSLAAVGIK